MGFTNPYELTNSTINFTNSAFTTDISTVQSTTVAIDETFFNKHQTEVIAGCSLLILFVLIALCWSLRTVGKLPCRKKKRKKKKRRENIDDELNYQPTSDVDI